MSSFYLANQGYIAEIELAQRNSIKAIFLIVCFEPFWRKYLEFFASE